MRPAGLIGLPRRRPRDARARMTSVRVTPVSIVPIGRRERRRGRARLRGHLWHQAHQFRGPQARRRAGAGKGRRPQRALASSPTAGFAPPAGRRATRARRAAARGEPAPGGAAPRRQQRARLATPAHVTPTGLAAGWGAPRRQRCSCVGHHSLGPSQPCVGSPVATRPQPCAALGTAATGGMGAINTQGPGASYSSVRRPRNSSGRCAARAARGQKRLSVKHSGPAARRRAEGAKKFRRRGPICTCAARRAAAVGGSRRLFTTHRRGPSGRRGAARVMTAASTEAMAARRQAARARARGGAVARCGRALFTGQKRHAKGCRNDDPNRRAAVSRDLGAQSQARHNTPGPARFVSLEQNFRQARRRRAGRRLAAGCARRLPALERPRPRRASRRSRRGRRAWGEV